jgi:hypothetical protein
MGVNILALKSAKTFLICVFLGGGGVYYIGGNPHVNFTFVRRNSPFSLLLLLSEG